MNKYKYYFVEHGNKLIIAFLLIFVFIYQRESLRTDETVISAFQINFNERRFLALYLNIYLVSLFPVLRRIFQTEYVCRISTKWKVIEKLWGKITIMALEYSLLLSFVWYAIVGSGIENTDGKSYFMYIFCIFAEQFIGWMEIGMFEVLAFILVQHLLLGFILCESFFILMNLSLYIGSNEKILQYTRLYDFMFNPMKINDIYAIVSIGLFHIVIISLLFLVSHNLIKRHDYLKGGKKAHEN